MKTVYIGEQYCFQTYLDSNDKTKAASEFKVENNFVKIGIEDEEDKIKDFFRADLFYQPTQQEIKLYNEPEKAKDLSQCFTLVAIKEVEIEGSINTSKCSCSDFKLVGYCIHIIGLLLYYQRITIPLALQAPGNVFIFYFLFFFSEKRSS